MKFKKLKTAKQLLDTEFGKDGTATRKQFQKEAYSFYLSEILKSRRIELKLSQEELAKKVGKKRPYISRVENGEDLRISNFVQIAMALNLTFDLQPI
jgi:DNA-binding XRE family transcriptional regulator